MLTGRLKIGNSSSKQPIGKYEPRKYTAAAAPFFYSATGGGVIGLTGGKRRPFFQEPSSPSSILP
jgi:hypothetical protein